jgi:hypothetical protein
MTTFPSSDLHRHGLQLLNVDSRRRPMSQMRKKRLFADGLAKGPDLTLSGHCRWCRNQNIRNARIRSKFRGFERRRDRADFREWTLCDSAVRAVSVLCRHATRHVVEAANRRTQVALVAELLLACCVFVLQSAFEYLSRVLSRERVLKFNNSRDLKVCELPCKELLDLLCCQRCITVSLHRGNKRLAEF